jgi:hypothetical protein
MARRKKIKAKAGDVFTFRLNNNLNCFGQIVAGEIRPHREKLYVLFDYASEEIPSIDSIINKPVLGIANMIDSCIEDGEWIVIGNAEVMAQNITLPNFIISDGLLNEYVIMTYDEKLIRISTEEEFWLVEENKIPNLRFWSSITPSAFEDLANYKFNDGEWHDYFSEIIFAGSIWDAAFNKEGIPLKEILNKKEQQVDVPQELRMIKDISSAKFFSYSWVEPDKVFIQEGIVGEEFQLYEVVLTPEKQAHDVMKQIENTLLEQGFEYFDYEDYTNIIIRFALSTQGFGTKQDLIKKNEIEDILSACLRSTGNGDCDGSEIGNGELLIFCHVIDQQKAIGTIKKELKKHNLLQEAEITYSLNEDLLN